MPPLHDPAVHDAILSRLNGLRADSRGRWGKMSVDQMLWHVNEGLEAALGRVTPEPMKFPLPPRVLRFMLLNFPWMKGAPTNPRFLARATHDFDAERERCRRLIAEISTVPIDAFGINHPVLGRMSGRENSRLHAKHLDHHLRQFGM